MTTFEVVIGVNIDAKNMRRLDSKYRQKLVMEKISTMAIKPVWPRARSGRVEAVLREKQRASGLEKP